MALLFSAIGTHFVKPVNAKTITVPNDYSTIQAAIDATNDGDTVFVKTGYYPETLVINKSLTFIGQDREQTIIDAAKNNTVVEIDHAYVTFANFTFGNTYKPEGYGRYVTPYGISLKGGYGHITNNTIVDVFGAAFEIDSDNNTIENNLMINCNSFLIIFGVNNTVVNNAYSQGGGSILTYAPENANVIEGNKEVNLTDVPSPFPSPSPEPTSTPTSPTSTPTPTPYQEPQQTEQLEIIIGVTIAAVVIGAGLGLLIYLIKRK